MNKGFSGAEILIIVAFIGVIVLNVWALDYALGVLFDE